MTVIKKTEKEKEVAPAGTTRAVIVGVYDIGVHTNKAFEVGKPDKDMQQFIFLFELEDRRSDGTPFTLSLRMNASLNDRATLRKFLTSMLGELTPDQISSGIELNTLLHRSCYVQVVHYERKDKKRSAKIAGIPSPFKKTEPPLQAIGDGKVPKWVIEEALSAKIQPDWVKGVPMPEEDLAF